MSVKCCAAGCLSESDFNETISFFQFPEDKERCHDWLDSIGREDLKELSVSDVCSQYYVCSLHFDETYLQTCNEDGTDGGNGAVQNEDDTCKEMLVQDGITNEATNVTIEENLDILDEDGKTKLVFVEGIGHVRLKTEDSDEVPKTKTKSTSKDSFIFHSNRSKLQTSPKVQRIIEENGNYILYVVDENEAASVSAATASVTTGANNNNSLLFVKHSNDLLKVFGGGINLDEGSKNPPSIDSTPNKVLKIERQDDSDYANISDNKITENDHNNINNSNSVVDDEDINELLRQTNCKTFLCHTCGQKFKDVNDLTTHMYSHHSSLTSNGDDGDEFESEAGDGDENIDGADADGDMMIFKCADCDQSFNMFDQLRIHVRNHVQSRNYSCDVCGAAFSHRSNLSRHKLQHCSAKKFQCDQCGKGFSQKSNLMSHQSVVHSSNSTVIISSLGIASRPGAERIHRKPKVHSCEVCGKTFVSLTGLKNHGALHTGVRPYKCAICDKSFTLMSCLKTHMATIHTDKKHYCELCGKSYQSEHYLKIHLRIHTGTKDFECELCSKRFIDLPSLKLHTRTHTGEKPFVCKMCSRSFTQQSHLKTHMRIHTGEKPYQCKDCGKFFRQLSNVLEHARTHRKS